MRQTGTERERTRVRKGGGERKRQRERCGGGRNRGRVYIAHSW